MSPTDSRPIYLLGVTCNIHESSAALVKDGQLVAAAEEERFTRTKHDSRFPAQAIAYCLREAGISMRELSYAGFYWQPWKGVVKRLWWLVRYFPASLQTFQGGKHWRGSAGTLLSHLGVPFRLWRMGFRGRFHFVDHHMAHAASAFLRDAVPVRRDSDHRSVRRGLHDAVCPRLGQPHGADPPLRICQTRSAFSTQPSHNSWDTGRTQTSTK